MALRKQATAPSAAPTITFTGNGGATVPATDTPKRERPEVRGQVAMHAIITGYKVASQLAATLAASPDAVRSELHKLAAEVAAKIEDYTFKGE